MGTGELNAGGNPAMDWHPIQGGVEIVASCYGNRDKLRPGGPLGSYADFTLHLSNSSSCVRGLSFILYLAPVVRRLDNAIQRINVNKTNHAIRWIVIYPVDSVIQLLNNRGLHYI